MIRRLLAAAVALSALAVPLSASADPGAGGNATHDTYYLGTKIHTHPIFHKGNLYGYASAAETQLVCPQDDVVWLNTDKGVYFKRDTHWYGHTKHGAFVCRLEAAHAGKRAARNQR